MHSMTAEDEVPKEEFTWPKTEGHAKAKEE
jgi:hypothetical protein